MQEVGLLPNGIGKNDMYFEIHLLWNAWDWRCKYHSALAVEKLNVEKCVQTQKNLRKYRNYFAYIRNFEEQHRGFNRVDFAVF